MTRRFASLLDEISSAVGMRVRVVVDEDECPRRASFACGHTMPGRCAAAATNECPVKIARDIIADIANARQDGEASRG